MSSRYEEERRATGKVCVCVRGTGRKRWATRAVVGRVKVVVARQRLGDCVCVCVYVCSAHSTF